MDLAKAVANGSAPSPSRLGASTLFAIRITGTGYATRENEKVWRDPTEWTKPQMLERCNGLSVIWEHPPGKTLDSDEFADRAIGAVNYTYLAGKDGIENAQGAEVWCVARVFDDAAATLMVAEPASTSPCVVFTKGNEGARFGNLLIENQPAQLDHVAICKRGVWDTGDAPSGVRIDIVTSKIEKDQAVADEKDEGTAKILEVLDSICKRLNTSDTRMEALESAEADRKKAADARRKADEDPTEVAAAGDNPLDPMTSGPAMKIAVDSRRRADKTEEEWEPRSDADYAEWGEAQADADRVANAFGINGARKAPPRQYGESPRRYRTRVAGKYKEFSPAWKDVQLHTLPPNAADVASRQIFADAIAFASSPVSVPKNTLREHVTIDAAGRRISTFYGSPRAWMEDFRLPPQYLVRFNKGD